MNFTEGSRAVTYCNVVIVTENHLRFVTGRNITYKRLVNVYKFRVHVHKINDRRVTSHCGVSVILR